MSDEEDVSDVGEGEEDGDGEEGEGVEVSYPQISFSLVFTLPPPPSLRRTL